MTSPSLFDWLTVAAIVTGPVLALAAQRALDYLREKRNQRTHLYLTLMSTRTVPLSPDHIKGCNLLDTVFSRRGSKDRKVREAWERMLKHVASSDENQQEWQAKLIDLRVDLYQAVGRAVGYDHSVEYIKTHIYAPKYHVDVELDQTRIREGFAKILSHDGLKVVVAQPDQKPEPEPSGGTHIDHMRLSKPRGTN